MNPYLAFHIKKVRDLDPETLDTLIDGLAKAKSLNPDQKGTLDAAKYVRRRRKREEAANLRKRQQE